MRSRSPRDRGAVSAELAVVLPVVVVILATCLGAVRVAVEQVRVADAAALAARSLARGDGAGSATAVVTHVSGARLSGTSRSGDIVCATTEEQVALLGSLGVIPVRVRSCALTTPELG